MKKEEKVIWSNSFDTPRGQYTLRCIYTGREFFIRKTLNGNIVEIVNLSKRAKS